MRPTRTPAPLLLAAAVVAGALVAPTPAHAAPPPLPTIPVSVLGGSVVPVSSQAFDNRTEAQSVSGDGRYIAFSTLVGTPEDTNGTSDVYLRDRHLGTTELISTGTSGYAAGGATNATLSSDGRYVGFTSAASSIVPGDTGGLDAFVRDRVTGTTAMVNRTVGSAVPTATLYDLQLSADGSTVLLVDMVKLQVRRLANGATTTITGTVADASLSGDGRYVAYNLDDPFVVRRRDTTTGTDVVVSQSLGGIARTALYPSISYDGRWVAFVSHATDLVAGDALDGRDLFLRDMDTGTTTSVFPTSVDVGTEIPVLSGDGSAIAFYTQEALVPEDDDGDAPDYYRVWAKGSPEPVLLTGNQVPALRDRGPYNPEISGDGHVVTITTQDIGGVETRHAVGWFARTDADLRSFPITSGYQAVFGRNPTTAEANAALTSLKSFRRTFVSWSQDLVHTPSHWNPRAPMVRLYRAYFLRSPDLGGYDFWVGKRVAGRPLHQISSTFAASSEFRTRYGSLTNRQFVELIYMNVLGRPGDLAGVTSWTKKLDTGAKTRGEVMVGFSESSEHVRTTADVVDLIVSTRDFRDRMPTQVEVDERAARAKVGIPFTDALTQIID